MCIRDRFIAMISLSSLQNRMDSDAVKIMSGSIEPCICRGISNDADFLLCAALMHKDGIKLRNMSPVAVSYTHLNFMIHHILKAKPCLLTALTDLLPMR